MRVFIAGATGTLGLPLVSMLRSRGHEVIGLTRSPERARVLEELGAAAVVADALEPGPLERVVTASRPTHVVHALTALPKQGPLRLRDMAATNELRTVGTRNLLDAARAAGAERMVAESMMFVYGYGDHGATPKSEADAFRPREEWEWLQSTVEAMRSLESQLLEANARGEIEGIPLRFAAFYGPQSPSTRAALRLLKRRLMPRIRGADGVWSFVHVEDAALATVQALEHGRPGEIYNIADDEPIGMNEFLERLAAAGGAPRPWSVPLAVMRILAPYAAAALSTRLALSSAKAKNDLGWSPRYADSRVGLEQTVRALSRER